MSNTALYIPSQISDLVGLTAALNDRITGDAAYTAFVEKDEYNTLVSTLGDAATRDVGTSAGTVAAGDHLHDDQYARLSSTNTYTGGQNFYTVSVGGILTGIAQQTSGVRIGALSTGHSAAQFEGYPGSPSVPLIRLAQYSSTGTLREAASIDAPWTINTDATRTSKLTFATALNGSLATRLTLDNTSATLAGTLIGSGGNGIPFVQMASNSSVKITPTNTHDGQQDLTISSPARIHLNAQRINVTGNAIEASGGSLEMAPTSNFGAYSHNIYLRGGSPNNTVFLQGGTTKDTQLRPYSGSYSVALYGFDSATRPLLRFDLPSSTATQREAASVTPAWTDPTDATRTSELKFSTVLNGSSAERLAVNSSGLTVKNNPAPSIKLVGDGTKFTDLPYPGITWDSNQNYYFAINPNNLNTTTPALKIQQNGVVSIPKIQFGFIGPIGDSSADTFGRVEASKGAIRFGTNTPSQDLVKVFNQTAGDTRTWSSTLRVASGSASAPTLVVENVAGQTTPALSFQAPSSSAAIREAATIDAPWTDATDALRTGAMVFKTATNGVLGERLRLGQSSLFSGKVSFGEASSYAPSSWIQVRNTDDNAAMVLESPNLNQNSVLALFAPLGDGLTGGKAFSVNVAGETSSRAMFGTDGSYNIGPGQGLGRDTRLARNSSGGFLLSAPASQPLLSLRGQTGQTGTLLNFQQVSSTGVARDAASIDAVWSTNTDSSRTGRLTLSTVDFNGKREALRLEADGAQPKIGFLGAPAIGRATLPPAATDEASAIALANSCRQLLINLGLAQ